MIQVGPISHLSTIMQTVRETVHTDNIIISENLYGIHPQIDRILDIFKNQFRNVKCTILGIDEDYDHAGTFFYKRGSSCPEIYITYKSSVKFISLALIHEFAHVIDMENRQFLYTHYTPEIKKQIESVAHDEYFKNIFKRLYDLCELYYIDYQDYMQGGVQIY